LLDPAVLARIRRSEVDAIVFASPSAFQNLRDVIGAAELANLSARVQFAAIGPTTARTIRDSGARVEIRAEEASAEALAGAIAKHFQGRSATVRHS
jgi:uroporphyrinogen-III synthase